MGEPQGLRCPGCELPPFWPVLDGGRQAVCGNPDCRVFTWDPTRTFAELVEGAHFVDMPDRDEPGN